MNYEINTFDDLIIFIETKELKENQIYEIVQKTINVLILLPIDKEFSKQKLIKEIKEFWSKWGNKPVSERPIFLTDSID